jgi:hypothetical protein
VQLLPGRSELYWHTDHKARHTICCATPHHGNHFVERGDHRWRGENSINTIIMQTISDSETKLEPDSHSVDQLVRCFICNGTGFAVFPMLRGGQPCDCGEHSLRMWKHECRAVLKAKAEGKDVITSIWHPVKKWVQQEMEKADGIRETGAERVARILGIPEKWL